MALFRPIVVLAWLMLLLGLVSTECKHRVWARGRGVELQEAGRGGGFSHCEVRPLVIRLLSQSPSADGYTLQCEPLVDMLSFKS